MPAPRTQGRSSALMVARWTAWMPFCSRLWPDTSSGRQCCNSNRCSRDILGSLRPSNGGPLALVPVLCCHHAGVSRVLVLGATGSIGLQALEVISQSEDLSLAG